MTDKYTLDLDFLSTWYPVTINGEPYDGHIAMGDTLTMNGMSYSVLGINEDAVIVRPLPIPAK